MKKKPVSKRINPVFGQFNWEKPLWLQQISAKTLGITIALFLLFCLAIAFGIHWYKSLPKPDYISASIRIPGITANQDNLVPKPLIIHFGIAKQDEFINKSVAPLQAIGKTISKGISLSPAMKGQWYWSSDNQLIFTPEEDWPADQNFRIQFAKDFFAPNAKMEGYDFSFKTREFKAKIREFSFYQNPIRAEDRKAVATIAFNFPVDTASLEKNTSLIFEQLDKTKEKTSGFTYSFDKNKRIAYLHSQAIEIKKVARYLQLNLNKNIRSSTGSGLLKESLSKNLLIPDTSSFLKVVSANASVVRNAQDKPEQVLSIETSLGVEEADFNRFVQVYQLPVNYPATATEKEIPDYAWKNPGEVNESILKLSTVLPKQNIPTEHSYSTLHSYQFAAHTPRYLYIKIDKGLKGFGNFSLSNPYTAIVPVPELPKEIRFLHKGSLLALSGDKKFSVLVRGLPAVRFDFARVLPANVNQLVSQSQGDFNNPNFINPNFNQQNISQIFSDIQQFDNSDLSKQQYTALDIGRYLNTETNTLGPLGLFLLEARGWDLNSNTPLDVKSTHLLLVTDLGLLVKDNNDGSHEVFVQSITQGAPVEGVKVSVLGKNGLDLLTKFTDSQGRVSFPNLKDFVEDREPTVYLASLNQDVSFIPYRNEGRQLNVSKFDVGGIYTANSELHNLSAYLFSDRGIYRPGDTVHLGMIIKQAFVQAQPAGLPLQATVYDPRGTSIKEQKFILNESGFMALDINTEPSSPTGQYRVDLSLMKDDLPQNLLGSVNIRLAEFLPDRMRISSSFSPKPSDGWSSPTDLKAKVLLMNLYGAPAANRRIAAKILLTPEKVAFKEYPDYIFADPLQDPKKPAKIYTENLADTKTNDKGEASLDLNLNRFDKASYQLTVFVEGFEADGGRSVSTQIKTLVSPLAYFVGYKSDGDLSFIKQNSQHSVDFIAVNPQLTKEKLGDLKIQLVSLHPVTTLVKKADGTYQYQSIIQSSVISSKAFTIKEQGSSYTLASKDIGDYSVQILDKDETVLSQLKYSVVGDSQRPLAKDAQLSVKLNKEQFQAGENIELQITAPYTGSGLITIERDKVHAATWFKAQTTNSMQSIGIPADFQGNGYVNVAFIRDWSSPELFISPLSYAVLPFDINHDQHAIEIGLKTAQLGRPGEPFEIEYQTNKNSKIIVFAVDEGILQVSKFKTPDPLAFFFQKNALEVLTQQTVDQILPQFILDRELSAAGGDGGEAELASHLNPFKRKTDLPVVFWSGIIDASATAQTLRFTLPDYFNGSLRVMAVAVSADAVGSKDSLAKIRGDFIINPNVPTFVAPGDEFIITASIANNVKNSGDNALVTVELSHSPEVELIGDAKQSLTIAEGHEQVVHYKFRASSSLGAASVKIVASAGNKSSAMSSSLSIRPASPLTTYVSSGQSRELTKTLDLMTNFYPQFHQLEATMSTSPMILLFGLQRYLDNFPFGCTEQLVSKAMPVIAMNSQSGLPKDSKAIDEKIITTIQLLGQRQLSNGSFSYWPGLNEHADNDFASVYAMHFLTLAKGQGYNVPSDLFYTGISYLKELAALNPKDLKQARIQAYAIYILTRNEIVTSNYLANLMLFLEKDASKSWQEDISGAYIAASYQLLKSDEEAIRLISRYKMQNKAVNGSDFFDNHAADAQYLYILAKHFPERLKQLGDTVLMSLVDSMNNSEINTIFSGYCALALAAYQETQGAQAADYHKQKLGLNDQQVHFNNPKKLSFFYQLIQAGFEKTSPSTPLKQGIEIYREYRNANGEVINETDLGAEIEVHLQIRALDQEYLPNIAIMDLLPGGFEVVSNSVKAASMDYFDVREDRVNFFGSIDSSTKEIIYTIKATNRGKYQVPPPYAQAMYNPNTKGRGLQAEMSIK